MKVRLTDHEETGHGDKSGIDEELRSKGLISLILTTPQYAFHLPHEPFHPPRDIDRSSYRNRLFPTLDGHRIQKPGRHRHGHRRYQLRQTRIATPDLNWSLSDIFNGTKIMGTTDQSTRHRHQWCLVPA